MFKKDLGKLGFIASEGKGRLVTIKYTDQEIDREQSFFMGGVAAFSTEIFNTNVVIDLLDIMSRKHKADLLEEGKVNQVTMGDEFYTNVIKDTIEGGNRYSYDDFDRYDNYNITPNKEVIGLSIKFIDRVTKLFDFELQYIFMEKYIVGVEAYTRKPLFFVGGIKMPKQFSLLEQND